MVKLDVEIYKDTEDSTIFCAALKTDESIIMGYGDTPYKSLRDLIDEIEYQHQYFRADSE